LERDNFGQWIPLSMVVLSALVMAWFGWQQLREPATSTQISGPAVAERPAENRSAEPADPLDEAGAPRTLTEAYSSASAAAENQPEVMDGAEEDRRRLSRSVSEFTAQDDNARSQAMGQEQGQGKEQELAAVQPVAERQSARPDDSPDRSDARPRKSGRSVMEPHVAKPISYWELPQGIRDNLPNIKITVLVFSERAQDRFLLANGQRMTEKDELVSGLVLDEIRRDGAVFLYRNYRFLVKG
jgi:hypothetical protein